MSLEKNSNKKKPPIPFSQSYLENESEVEKRNFTIPKALNFLQKFQ